MDRQTVGRFCLSVRTGDGSQIGARNIGRGTQVWARQGVIPVAEMRSCLSKAVGTNENLHYLSTRVAIERVIQAKQDYQRRHGVAGTR